MKNRETVWLSDEDKEFVRSFRRIQFKFEYPLRLVGFFGSADFPEVGDIGSRLVEIVAGN